MPNPRAPLAKLAASGTLDKNPSRYKGRTEPQSQPLGRPSSILNKQEAKAWFMCCNEAPWLREGDRVLVELVCQLRAKMWTRKGLDSNDVSTLIRVLSKLGMTPVDRSRVLIADDDQAKDQAESFFN
jgi:hypothetical protein